MAAYLCQQLNGTFPDNQPVRNDELMTMFQDVFEKLEHCFSHVNNEYFFDGEYVLFNHLHADQYAMFLYLMSRHAYRTGMDRNLTTKIFLLNKALHAIDAYYEIELPSVFLFVHPSGTVLGRGKYDEFFTVYQHCCIGSNHGVYPVLGRMLTMHPGSSVLGDCILGNNVSLAAGSLLKDRNIDSNTIYIGNPRDYIFKPQVQKPKIWRNISMTDIE